LNFAVDLDGTLAEWDEDHFVCGTWKPGAQEALRTILTVPTPGENRVIVHSCRATWAAGGGTRAVEQFILNGGFVPILVDQANQETWVSAREVGDVIELRVGIWVGRGKPIAHWYVDDRAIEFKGNWETTLAAMQLKMHGN
jgi:hypothetical protein